MKSTSIDEMLAIKHEKKDVFFKKKKQIKIVRYFMVFVKH